MGEGKVPKPFLAKEPDIILKVSGLKEDDLTYYIKASLETNIVENLGWSIYDLRALELALHGENDRRIQGCLAKHNTSILQLIIVQQSHMYVQLRKKIAKTKMKMKEIDAEIDGLNHESFMDTMTIFAEQLYCIAAIAFAFASTPLIAGIAPAVVGFATTGFTLRDYVKTITEKDQYKQKKEEIALEIQKLISQLQQDLWHDYIYPPAVTETMLMEKSTSEESTKEDRRENQVQLKAEDQLYQQAEEIRKLREEVTSLQAQMEDIRGKQLKK